MPAHPITINVNLLTADTAFGGDPGAFVECARLVEEAGLDGVVMPDHVVFGRDVTYPFGGWALDSAASWPEPMTVLAAIAGATRRIDLVTNVLVAPLRPAALLAKQVATLHGLSRGRFQLGVGAGWQREEYDASGVPFAGRSQRLFEQMQAARALWDQRPAAYRGETVAFEDVWCVPGLADRPLKLWFGVAPTAGNARFLAEFGGGWSCIHPDPAYLAEGRATLEAALRERHGITRTLPVRAAPPLRHDAAGRPSLERSLAALPEAIAAGATEFDVPTMFYVEAADGFEPFVRGLAAARRALTPA